MSKNPFIKGQKVRAKPNNMLDVKAGNIYAVDEVRGDYIRFQDDASDEHEAIFRHFESAAEYGEVGYFLTAKRDRRGDLTKGRQYQILNKDPAGLVTIQEDNETCHKYHLDHFERPGQEATVVVEETVPKEEPGERNSDMLRMDFAALEERIMAWAADIETAQAEQAQIEATLATRGLKVIDKRVSVQAKPDLSPVHPSLWKKGDMIKCITTSAKHDTKDQFIKDCIYELRKDCDGEHASVVADAHGRENGWAAKHFQLHARAA